MTASASVIGSVHVRDGLPLQDAVHTWQDADRARAVVAVADGHGHRLHFRSDTGAALAVVSAVEELRRILEPLEEMNAGHGADDAATALVRRAGEAIVATWSAKVGHHLAAHPYDAAELALGAGTDPVRAYGSTVLAVAAAGPRLVFVQIGDGDSVAVTTGGVASRPLPEDPLLDGTRTTSLCQPRPLDALRVATRHVEADDVGLVYLCTDGFGRPRVDADWWVGTGAQLAGFTRERGVEWVRSQLPEWLEEPARVGGDDTTLALLALVD